MFASAASCTQSCSVFSYIQSLKGIFSRGPFLTHLCFCDKENKVICWPWKQQLTKYCHHKSPEQMFVITVRLRSLIWVLIWPLGSSGDILWKQKKILWWPFKLIWWASVRILASFGMSQLWVITFLIKMSFQFQGSNSNIGTNGSLGSDGSIGSIGSISSKCSTGSNSSFGDTDVSEIFYWFLWEESLLLGTIETELMGWQCLIWGVTCLSYNW